MGRRELFEEAVDRHGVVVAYDVLAAGMSPATFHAWRQRERMDQPLHDVTVLPGAPDTPEQRLAIAVAGIGPASAVTGWAAAYLYGLRDLPPTRVTVLVPHGASHRPHDRVTVVETSVFDEEHLEDRRGIPVVGPARLLADLARDVELDALLNLAIDLRVRHGLTRKHLVDQLTRRRRFPGRARFRALVELLEEDGSDSGFELFTRRRLTDRGTPPDPGQHELVVAGRRRRIDLPYADARVGIECRGLAFHGRNAFDRDAERHNDFAVDGRWVLLELTWRTFLQGWDPFCARLDRVLASRR